MGLFGTTPDPITQEVEKATCETNIEDDWVTIMNICDKAGKSSEDAKNYLRAINKRLLNTDPHVAIQAATLLDACVKNSKKIFHTEIASREFEDNFMKFMSKCHPTVAKNLRISLKKWAEMEEFKNDPQLNLIPTLYSKLKSQNLDFSADEMPVKKSAPMSKDPNVVESQEEEEQILKAIELSLKESGSPRSVSAVTGSSSLYPSASVNAHSASVSSANTTPAKDARKVRALYDFEAAEDNELTFSQGEIILVLDDSDPNWWKGSNQRGEGLFPSNFVTSDLHVEPEKFLYEKGKKIVQFKESVDVKPVDKEPEEVEIDEAKIDRLLHLLHEADPTNPEKDTEEMLKLEKECNAMQPLIDSELERVDRKHAQLTQLSADLVEALSLYHTLMREPQMSSVHKMPFVYSPSMPTSSMNFNGTLPHTGMGMNSGIQGSNVMPPNLDRPMYMPSGNPNMPQPNIPQHYQSLPGMMTSNRLQMGGHMPPGVQSVPSMNAPGMPPHHIPTQLPEDRRHEGNMMPYPGMPNYGPGGVPPNFQQAPVGSQTHLQNVPPSQGPHYISTSNSSHIM